MQKIIYIFMNQNILFKNKIELTVLAVPEPCASDVGSRVVQYESVSSSFRVERNFDSCPVHGPTLHLQATTRFFNIYFIFGA